jgi:hypothetical protein
MRNSNSYCPALFPWNLSHTSLMPIAFPNLLITTKCQSDLSLSPSGLHSLRQSNSFAEWTQTALALQRRWRRCNRSSMASRTVVETVAWRPASFSSILMSIPTTIRTVRPLWCTAHSMRTRASHATWSEGRGRWSALRCAVTWLAIIRRVHSVEAP